MSRHRRGFNIGPKTRHVEHIQRIRNDEECLKYMLIFKELKIVKINKIFLISTCID